MSLNDIVRQRLNAQLAHVTSDDVGQLNNALRLLSKWRSAHIQNTVLKRSGTVVWQGPLKGLDFLPRSAEGCHIAKLLGCYEQPLLPFIERAIQANYTSVINVGCAEGYYAVGMARRMPSTKMFAFDLDTKARETCGQLAARNGVSDRVHVGELFRATDFAAYAGERKVLVLCDIEGAEKALLDPSAAPDLLSMDIIVESHEVLIPGITTTLADRFAHSHEITHVQDNGQRQLETTPDWFDSLAHLDQLLAVWEWRSGPTPWLVMKARS